LSDTSKAGAFEVFSPVTRWTSVTTNICIHADYIRTLHLKQRSARSSFSIWGSQVAPEKAYGFVLI